MPNSDNKNPKKLKTQSETSGGPPKLPPKIGAGYGNEGEYPIKLPDSRDARLAHLVEERLTGMPLNESDLKVMAHWNITNDDIEAEIKLRHSKNASD